MNRRTFLASGAAAGAFYVAASGKAWGVSAPSNRIRLCVVGCSRTSFDPETLRHTFNPKGNRGRGYQVMIGALKVPGVEIAAVCDVDRIATEYAASEVKRIAGNAPRQYKDMREAFADPDIDGVIVATPDHWHVTAGIWALKAKKALYLEKPIGIAPGEAKVLARVYRETGGIFQLGTQRRSSYASVMAVEAIRSGKYGKPRWAKAWCLTDRPRVDRCRPMPVPEEIGDDGWRLWQGPAPRTGAFRGELVHYNWRFFRGYGTGDLPNNGLHFVDIARWALGAGWATDIYAGGGKLFYEGEDFEYEDTQMLNVKFANGTFLTWEGCSHTGAKPFMGWGTGTLVYCDDAAVFFDAAGGSAIFDRKGKKTISEWKANDLSPEQLKGGVNASAGGGKNDAVHVQKFVECMRANDPKTAMPMDEALKSDLLPIAGNVSLRTREAVRINPETGELANPDCAAAKLWMPKYEPGWELS